MISNPPWIISKPIDEKDPGNYDQNGEFLKGLFSFAEKRLSKQGHLWMIYSSLSSDLGLAEESHIEKLA